MLRTLGRAINSMDVGMTQNHSVALVIDRVDSSGGIWDADSPRTDATLPPWYHTMTFTV